MEFSVLGPLQVTTDGREVEISANRHRTVLAALLLRPNRLVSTAELATYLWDEQPPGRARSTTQTYIRRLRGLLGTGVIETLPGGYRISVAPEQVDLTRFDGLLQQAHQSRQPRQEAALLSEALELWRGPVLINVESDLLHREQVPALAERRLRALERRLELDLATGRHRDAVVELQALTATHPLRERFWEQLMAALARCGRPAEALRAYEDLRQRLAQELGTDPSPPIQELYQAILRGQGPAADSTARLVPPLPVPPPAQLPLDVARFVGRTGALARLVQLSETVSGGTGPAVMICVIEGFAGVGKTALAVHVAHRVRAQYPDGQLFLNLRGHAEHPPMPALAALGVLLQALGVPPEQVPADLEPAAALYRSRLAGRRMLIVLDDAADPDQVRPLLPGCGACLVLITSRNRLPGLTAREGAYRLALSPLSSGEATALLGQLLRTAGIRPPATITELTELTKLCGQLPLALRIAATNLTTQPVQSLRDYLARLRATDRMAALTVTGDPRATMPASFNLSYQRQPDPVRALFRRLGLLPEPDTTAPAVAAFAGTTTERAEELLQSLADAYLLEQPAPGRYAMPGLLRVYAAQRAAEEDSGFDRRAALARLRHYHLAGAAAALLLPGLSEDAEVARIGWSSPGLARQSLAG